MEKPSGDRGGLWSGRSHERVPACSRSGFIRQTAAEHPAALEKIIEKAGEVEVTPAAVVAAVQAYAKINAQGQWIDRSEHVNLNELFERMSRKELEIYAQDGTLPAWFTQTVGVTQSHGRKTENIE